ncbi:FAD:protein FMN transferase [Candidatus Woesearchaeota archaeon]|nr:FAD:protein FMN transferase [Candidatus Woesearchaeota archaeon]
MKSKILFLLFAFFLVTGCSDIQKYSESRFLMGTEVAITAYCEFDCRDAINASFDEISRIEYMMSIYNPTSEVSVLNSNGYLRNPSRELLYLVRKSMQYSAISDGAFDITVQPLLDRWSTATNESIPTREEISRIVAERVGYQYIRIDEREIRFARRGMKITLGAIAKGYAIDRAVGLLKEKGVKTGMVNAGGDLYAFGEKEWKVALQDPRKKNDFITVINVKNKAVTTSGDYERYFVEKQAHHLMDPRTGQSATELISSTIVADTATDADALATTVFVMGVAGMNLVENFDNVEGLLITNDKIIIKSSGWGE